MTTLGAMAFWMASAILIACGSGVWGLMGKGCEGWAVVRLCVGIELGSTIGFPLVVSPRSARRFYQSWVLNDGNVTVAAIAVFVQPASWLSRGLAGRCNPVTIRFSDTPFRTESLPSAWRWAARSCRSVEQRAYPMSVAVMGGSVRIGSRIRNCYRTIHMRRSWFRFGGGVGTTDCPVRWTIPLRTALRSRDERITERWNMPRRSI